MDRSLLEIPRRERRTFKKHFLNSVHCEIGLVGVQSASIRPNRDHFAEGLAHLGFDHAGEFHQSSITLAGQLQGPPQLSHAENPIGIRFWSENPKRQLNVTPDGLVLSDFAYEGFEDFSQRLAVASQLICPVLGATSVRKLGLRKINSIRMDAVRSLPDAVSAFNPCLFSVARSGALVSAAFKTGQEVIVLERDSTTCVLRSALSSTGVPSSFDAYLDFDLIDQEQRELANAVGVKIHEMNAFLFDIFMWAVMPEFLAKMEG